MENIMTDKTDFLTQGDGYVDIALASPATIAGVQTDAVRMREPLLRDQLVMSSAKGTDAEREVMLIANLCEIAPDDLKAMTLRNYTRLQKAFLGFID